MIKSPSVKLPNEEDIVQQGVYELEDYKRRLGRNFDRAKTYEERVNFFIRYNKCENTIQMLVDKFHLERKYKPNKLKLEVL